MPFERGLATTSPDLLEGMAAFRDKRDAQFDDVIELMQRGLTEEQAVQIMINHLPTVFEARSADELKRTWYIAEGYPKEFASVTEAAGFLREHASNGAILTGFHMAAQALKAFAAKQDSEPAEPEQV